MKKTLLLAVMLISSVALWAYDFSDVAPSGQSLYYEVTDFSPHRDIYHGTDCFFVKVVAPNRFSWDGFTAPTGHLLIPRNIKYNNETYIVTDIGDRAFNGCTGLGSVSLPSTVTEIDHFAFQNCSELASIFFGYFFYSTLPPNFIGKQDGDWVAREIVLSDGEVVVVKGEDLFHAPVAFTAAEVTYSHNYRQGFRSTLCLPFKPSNVAETGILKFYAFSNFDNSTLYFSELPFDSLHPYTPYLVEWPDTKSQADFVFTASDVTFPATMSAIRTVHSSLNAQLIGTMKRTCLDNLCYGYKDGLFVRSTEDYPLTQCSSHAHANAFHAYLQIASCDTPQSLPPSLNVEVGNNGPLAIVPVETTQQHYDSHFGKDAYDLLGRLVRRNADNLDGLPNGIYIWKGKKVFNIK